MIEYSMADVDFPNVTIVNQLNQALLLYGGSNSLLSNSQSRKCGVALHDANKHHSVKRYIRYVYHVIPMKFYKALVYVYIREHN